MFRHTVDLASVCSPPPHPYHAAGFKHSAPTFTREPLGWAESDRGLSREQATEKRPGQKNW